MKKYVFRPYNSLFPELFLKEKQRIEAHIPNLLIEHVGSTAIPGLGGKGIIDIAIAVDKSHMKSVSSQLQEIGYEFKPGFSTPDRLYLSIFLQDRKYHVHLTYKENKEWKEFLGFRNYLIQNPIELQEYADIKEKAAHEADNQGQKYRDLKEPFINRIKNILSI